MDRQIIYFFCISLYITLIEKVACQPQMTISPTEVILSSSAPTNTTFTCSILPGISINTIYNLQILRLRESLDSNFIPLCDADPLGVGFVSGAASDIVKRGRVSGGLDTNNYAISTLVLILPTEEVLCNDKGIYQCKIVYQDQSSNVQTLLANDSLSIYALPTDANMTVRRSGQIVKDITNPVEFNVNEEVNLTCTALIGSDNKTQIQWRRTREFGTNDTFLIYNLPNGTYSDGVSSSTTTNCSYSRSATMTYNVTVADADRQNNLAFQCFISVVAPNGQTYEIQNPPTFYISVASTSSTELFASENTEDICGSSCFVLLVTFLAIGWTLTIVVIVYACYIKSNRALKRVSP